MRERAAELAAAAGITMEHIANIHIRKEDVELKPAGSPGELPVSSPYSDDTIDVTPEKQMTKERTPGGCATQREVLLGFGEDNDG